MLTSPHTFAFVEGDLLALNPRIKHMNLVDLASGSSLNLFFDDWRTTQGQVKIINIITSKNDLSMS